jgi:predicted GNAT superfamily acetyltransferase
MAIAIRDVRENELDSVLALNNAAGATILPLDAGACAIFSMRPPISASPKPTAISPDS